MTGAPISPAQTLLQAPTALQSGVSLVTCSKNRSGNLIRVLPSWLACPEISEIVIVDWCSDIWVTEELKAAGLTDPRLRIARVEDEPRWILSLAFNLGFRLARFDRILKTDADIVLAPGFFAANPLSPGSFIAGNWRRATGGQQYVNGFFYIHQTDLMAVNGFNEYITTYGWDDDELYDRLAAAGIWRIDVATGTVTHLDHDDDARMEAMRVERPDGWSDLAAQSMFKIRTNRFIATMMPGWNADRVLQPYALAGGTSAPVLRRAGQSIHQVPPHLRRLAERLAAYELLSWRCGLRVFNLTEADLDLLLRCLRVEAITALRVELMLAGADIATVVAPRLLIVDLDEAILGAAPARRAALAARLAGLADRSGRVLVLRAPRAASPTSLLPGLENRPYLASYYDLGPIVEATLDSAAADLASPVLRLRPGAGDLPSTPPGVTQPARANPAPAVTPARRDRLVIDAQHGLGNRLRAIGSAAAIAAATDRELVVIWQPDHHCDGRFGDLFEPDIAVEEQSFLAEAQARGDTVLNYMQIEPGSSKDAPLELVPGRDAYLRSAYVIRHPASDWEADNRLLVRLRPVAAVRALTASVPGPHDIGLHIRMEGSPGTDLNSYDRAENWTPEGHAAIHHWREKSHYSRFMARLDALLADTPQARVFLAADRPETYRAFDETYGPRVAWLERGLFDRSAAQLQYALADMLLLAGCTRLLGSNWSSFSEAAMRFSTTIRQRELAGVDF